MNLYNYLNLYLSRTNPYPVIDFKIRAELKQDGEISFYIHADGVDSATMDYIVNKDGSLKERNFLQ